jgi:nicotinamide mononucleotide (NMN) deamidase PncC
LTLSRERLEALGRVAEVVVAGFLRRLAVAVAVAVAAAVVPADQEGKAVGRALRC